MYIEKVGIQSKYEIMLSHLSKSAVILEQVEQIIQKVIQIEIHEKNTKYIRKKKFTLDAV